MPAPALGDEGGSWHDEGVLVGVGDDRDAHERSGPQPLGAGYRQRDLHRAGCRVDQWSDALDARDGFPLRGIGVEPHALCDGEPHDVPLRHVDVGVERVEIGKFVDGGSVRNGRAGVQLASQDEAAEGRPDHGARQLQLGQFRFG